MRDHVFEVKDNAATGVQKVQMFVDYSDGSGGMETRDMRTYAAEDIERGWALHGVRLEAGLYLSAGAELLNLRPVDMSGLERGTVVFVDPKDWERARALFRKHARSPSAPP